MITELISLGDIVGNPWQTRKGMDEEYITTLAEDIRKNGLLQAPVGRRVDDAGQAKQWGDQLFLGKKIQLAFGHNRLAAYRSLFVQYGGEWATMPVVVQELGDEQMAMMAWSENAARKGLTPIEEATAIQRDIEAFGWTQEQAAEKLGLARATVANKLWLLKLPEEIKKAVGEGKVSERQAAALRPMMDLPKEAIDYANKHTPSYQHSPGEIIKGMANGSTASSDSIRDMAASVIRNSTRDLTDCAFLSQVFEGSQFLTPECASCAWRMKGKEEDRCKRPDCYELKEQAWENIQGAEAMRISGLALVAKGENRNNWDFFYSYNDEEAKVAPIIFAQGCEKLRIARFDGGYHPNDITGYSMICLHGENGKCTCKAKELRELHKNDPAIALGKENEKRVQELKIQVETFLGNELLTGNIHAWRAYCLHLAYEDKKRNAIEKMTIDAMAASLVHNLVESWIGYQGAPSPATARKKLEEGLAKAGLKNPWVEQETPAQQAWNKVLRISGWIKTLSQVLPKVEAVRGNIKNLYDLLTTDSLDEDQRGSIKILIARLERIEPEVEDLDEQGFIRVSRLLHTPPGDVNFKGSLEAASPAVLRYTLALAPQGDGQKSRIEAIEARLRKITKRTLVEVFAEKEAAASNG